MAFVKSSLPSYVEQHKSDLLSASILAAKSAGLFAHQPGVNGPTTINLLDVGVTFANGASCGFSAAGNDTLTQRTITPGIIKINKSWCPKDLLGTYAAHEVEVGAGKETLPFEEKILGDLIAKIAFEHDKLLWQGDTVSGTGNMALANGIEVLTETDITNTVIPAANVVTAASADTIYDRIVKLIKAMPEAMRDTAELFMSYSNYDDLVLSIVNKNLYHYDGTIADSRELVFPGTQMKIHGIPGLIGVNKIYGFDPRTMVYGFDGENDLDNFSLWFSNDNDEFRLKVCFSSGVQYAFPDRIVVGKPYSA